MRRQQLFFVLIPLFLLGGALTLFALFDVRIQPRKQSVFAFLRPQPAADQPLAETPQNPTSQVLSASVAPQEGFTVPLRFGTVGKQLVKTGAIDLEKFRSIYKGQTGEKLLTYLTEEKNDDITINAETAYFWVNTLWALGLTQRSDVLDKGVMGTTYKETRGNFASTAGWTLGKKDALALYSSTAIIPLTPEENSRVATLAETIFRPCCGNSTAFPDCNHGMAMLGLLELMVSQEFTDEDIYKAALAFNTFWFPQTYVDLAYYFETREKTTWPNVDPKRVLSAQFSSSTGYQTIKQQIGTIPGSVQQGGSCGT
ncbi:MAG: hypothetical protein Q8R11_02650 [bacterium]|nr:hypothetical protein [bacterium]